jgi:carbon monoxide dehydrogenase subunit G
MIETKQQITIGAAIGPVWDYVRDMRRWAQLMPGMREYSVINDDDSRWTLKVGVGGLVRTVTVLVHVEEWAGPGSVCFSYRLEGDPVEGSGTYTATAQSAGETAVALHVQVVGSGPLAPMWEAMGRPLLPQLAKGFAEQLKQAIEAEATGLATPSPSAPHRAGFWQRLWQGLRRFFRIPRKNA